MLRGFEPGDRGQVSSTMERELARLFAEQGTPPSLAQGSEIECLNGGTFEMRPGFGAEAIGVQVAQSVYRGFGT